MFVFQQPVGVNNKENTKAPKATVIRNAFLCYDIVVTKRLGIFVRRYEMISVDLKSRIIVVYVRLSFIVLISVLRSLINSQEYPKVFLVPFLKLSLLQQWPSQPVLMWPINWSTPGALPLLFRMCFLTSLWWIHDKLLAFNKVRMIVEICHTRC